MSTPEQKKKGAKRGITFSPGSAVKATKKTKAGERGEEKQRNDDRDENSGRMELSDEEGFNASDLHEFVSTRVQETLGAFNLGSGEMTVRQLMPVLTSALTTAVSVAVTEAMRGVMKTMTETLSAHLQQTKSSANEKRLLSAVATLTYENDRLQQYTRRESVRIHGIKSAPGETADQVEIKTLEIFTALGAEVKPEDIAAVHRVGKEKKGSRPVLVKFVSRRKRREIIEKKKTLREKDQYRGIYINDDLTPLRARLLGMVQRLDNIEKAWTMDGRIFCLKKIPVGLSVQQKPIIIESPEDLFSKLGLELTSADFLNLGLPHLASFEDDE